MNKEIIILAMLACAIYAASCEQRVEPSTTCTVMTPVLGCSTNATIIKSDGVSTTVAMTPIGSGIYTFDFYKAAGSYTILLCDNSTADIGTSTTLDTQISGANTTILAAIEANSSETLDAITANSTQLDNAIVSTNSTLHTAITSVNDSVKNTNSTTQASFTTTNALITNTNATTQASFAVTDANVDAADTHIFAGIVNTNSTILAALSALETHGDSAWATATGFLTDSQMNTSHGIGMYNSSTSTSDIAGAVWNAATSSYNSSGTFGRRTWNIEDIVQALLYYK